MGSWGFAEASWGFCSVSRGYEAQGQRQVYGFRVLGLRVVSSSFTGIRELRFNVV